MAASGLSALIAIVGMAIATYVTRLAGLWLVRSFEPSGRTKAALDAVPPAILMAVIAPQVLTAGVPETLASVITVVAALRLPLIVALAAGVAAVVGLRLVLT
jgi:branched chain amino acid efflux pump